MIYAIVGLVDYLTGYEISISLFYLMPICLLSGFIDRKDGIIMSVISVVTIICLEIIDEKSFRNLYIELWNIVINFGFFIIIVYLISALVRDNKKRRSTEDLLWERVKALNCIYSLTDLIEKMDSIEEICQWSTDIITNGWYYPKMACVRITYENQVFTTENFRETPWKMSADIKVLRKAIGSIDVFYLKEMPNRDEGPFTRDERFLLNAIAERLGKVAERKRYEKERERLISELQKAFSEIKQLSGMIPICASCKKIRDDKGYWNQIEAYIRDHSEAEFSHSICPECAKELYPEVFGEK
jgi:K+-sensing histidine kinase KdpD